jgi:hypothetical protein
MGSETAVKRREIIIIIIIVIIIIKAIFHDMTFKHNLIHICHAFGGKFRRRTEEVRLVLCIKQRRVPLGRKEAHSVVHYYLYQ